MFKSKLHFNLSHKTSRLTLLAGVSYFFLSFKALSQDATFSQYYQAPLYLNPAFIGMEKNFYGGVNYRSQWKALANAYTTSQVSIINPVYQQRGRNKVHLGGMGLSILQDVAGDNGFLKTYGINLAGAYNINLNKNKSQNLSLSIQAGVINKQIAKGDLKWGSQYNNLINNGSLSAAPDYGISGSKVYPIVNSGILWFYKPEDRFSYYDYTAFAGISASNLNRPDESLVDISRSKVPILYKMSAGGEFPINRRVHWSPNLLIMSQGQTYQINGGLYLIYNLLDTPDEYNSFLLQFGAWYRYRDSFILLTGLTLKSLTINFSYDLNVSSLRQYTGGRGATEISLSYRIIKEKKQQRRTYPF